MTAQHTSAAAFLPERRTLPALRRAAAGCRGCLLYRNASQTVFGDGPAPAALLLVGEQPGDQEDRQGRPFVGPAGRLLERAVAAAGMPRDGLYLTNAVKHFKWEPRGKRRLHKRPLDSEVAACAPWLAAEVEAVSPHVVICLGVTAARAAFGRTVRLKDLRGVLQPSLLSPRTLVTDHPSALLRIRDAERRREAYLRFVAELRLATEAVGRSEPSHIQGGTMP